MSTPDFSPAAIRAINELKLREARLVENSYGSLSNAPVAPKIIPLYQRMDTLMSKSTATIACRENCSYCCYSDLYATPLEVFTVAEHIAAWPPAKREQIEQALRDYLNQVKGRDSLAPMPKDNACVFLDHGRCSIYAIRPFACRQHHSVDVGPCQRAFDDPTSSEKSVQDPVRVVAATAIQEVHRAYQKHVGRDTERYEFHAALLEALTNKASFKRWKSGKTAFPSIGDKLRS